MKYRTKKQRKLIYAHLAKQYRSDFGFGFGICLKLLSQTNINLLMDIPLNFPEFELFTPEEISHNGNWFDNSKEREICMLFCKEMCK